MRILLNASNVRHGGGLKLVQRLLHEVLPLRENDEVLLLCPARIGYEELDVHPNVVIKTVSDNFHKSFLSKLWQNDYRFRHIAQKFHVEKIVSLGNVAFPCRGIPQLVYLQTAQALYPESPAWKQMSFRNYSYNRAMVAYITAHLQYATSFAVQTEVMARRLKSKFEIEQDIYILPNSRPEYLPLQTLELPQQFSALRPLRLLFASHYYTHKNYEILLPLGQLILEKKLPVTITLTLDPEDAKEATSFLQALQEGGLSEVFPNVGKVASGAMDAQWQEHDGLFLPTLLESYTSAYPEAATHGKAIFTSHFDFATAMLGDAAFYFDPLQPDRILKELESAISEPELIISKAFAARQWILTQPDWKQVARSFSDIIDTFA